MLKNKPHEHAHRVVRPRGSGRLLLAVSNVASKPAFLRAASFSGLGGSVRAASSASVASASQLRSSSVGRMPHTPTRPL
jgi:hypothetical protein